MAEAEPTVKATRPGPLQTAALPPRSEEHAP